MPPVPSETVLSYHIRHTADFTYTAEVFEYRVEFKAYVIMARSRPDGSPMWRKIGASGGFDVVDDLQEAEVYLHGRVKWDGCSDWHFDEQDRVALHGCSRKDLLALGEVMAACWDLAKEYCPRWDH